MNSKTIKYISLLIMALAIVGCNNNDNAEGEDFSLSLVHINDHHSHLQESDIGLTVDDVEFEAPLGGFPRVVAKIDELVASKENVLKLHAGDAITGDLYYTLFRGEADAALMNEVCFDAFALGNHEFDGSDEGLVEFLDDLLVDNNMNGCETSVLAANVKPEVGVSPLALNSATDYIQPYVIKEFGDQKVGIIGIDIANKTKNSSNPLASTTFEDETETAQAMIDELTEQGVNKIVLLTHYQYDNDIALAQNLKGVDVIVGGDSHSLLGDFSDYGLNAVGTYPTMQQDTAGKDVCIVQAWQYSNIVGELNITFDGEGNVKECVGTPHLLIGDSFTVEIDDEDVELTGQEKVDLESKIDAIAQISMVTPDEVAASLLSSYSGQVEELQQQVVGTATEDLCFERILGQGRSEICDVADTAMNGSDISNVVALAFKEMSITSDIAIQNGGGVRTDISAGDITIADAYTLLPFSNTLVEIEITGVQIKSLLEEALAFALDPDGSTGAYPYASGLRWSIDATQADGQRFSSIEVKLKGESTWSAIEDNTIYTVVTNSFIASGRDGYETFAGLEATDTYLDYAQSFVDYVTREGTISKLATDEYSTQQYIPAE